MDKPEYIATWRADLVHYPWQVSRRTYSPDGKQHTDTYCEAYAHIEAVFRARPYTYIEAASLAAWKAALEKRLKGRVANA